MSSPLTRMVPAGGSRASSAMRTSTRPSWPGRQPAHRLTGRCPPVRAARLATSSREKRKEGVRCVCSLPEEWCTRTSVLAPGGGRRPPGERPGPGRTRPVRPGRRGRADARRGRGAAPGHAHPAAGEDGAARGVAPERPAAPRPRPSWSTRRWPPTSRRTSSRPSRSSTRTAGRPRRRRTYGTTSRSSCAPRWPPRSRPPGSPRPGGTAWCCASACSTGRAPATTSRTRAWAPRCTPRTPGVRYSPRSPSPRHLQRLPRRGAGQQPPVRRGDRLATAALGSADPGRTTTAARDSTRSVYFRVMPAASSPHTFLSKHPEEGSS